MEPKIESITNYQTPNISPKKTSDIATQVITVISWIVGFAIGKYLGLALFIFLIPYLIGVWFPTWYLKRPVIKLALIKWIAWSNVITWFLPPLGIMIGFATLGFSNNLQQESRKYKTLAIAGISASLLNGIVGVLLQLQ